MRIHPLLKGVVLIAIGAVLLPTAKAASPTTSSAAADASPVPASVAVPGWTDFLDGLRDVDRRFAAEAPALLQG